MSGLCPSCGLVNFRQAVDCRRCGATLAQATSELGFGPEFDSVSTGSADPSATIEVSSSQLPSAPLPSALPPPYAPPKSLAEPPFPSAYRQPQPRPDAAPVGNIRSPFKTQVKPAASVAVIVSFLTVYTLMSIVGSELRFMIYVGLAAGLLAGLVPFFVARGRGQNTLAGYSLLVCAVSGGVLGLLLAVPAAIVFTAVALSRKAQ